MSNSFARPSRCRMDEWFEVWGPAVKNFKRRLFEVKALTPGETVAISGVYRVVHVDHRADHEVLAITGDVLPDCRVCLGEVRFYVEKTIDYAPHDWDLAGPISLSKASAK